MKLHQLFASTIIVIGLSSWQISAKEAYGKITNIKGEGFISVDGKTKSIKLGDAIYPNSELVVEHDGQLSFSTFDNQVFHLGKASSMAVTANPKEVVLRAGEIWFQSLNKTNSTKLSTANAAVEVSGGEGILVYDSMKAKSQLVVINGLMKISNTRAPDVGISVSEGNFSYVDNAYDNGIPRDPTPVGEKTYTNLLTHFPGISPLDKNAIQVFQKEVVASKKTNIETRNHADDILSAYRDQIITAPKAQSKNSRGIASVKADVKSKKAPDTSVKIFGTRGEKTMTFGEEFSVPTEIKAGALRGPASFSAPEVEENKAGDTKALEEHDRETKKLMQQLQSL